MKAARYEKYGGPEVIKIVEIPIPQITESQVLIKNFAASINPFDFKVRIGMVPGMPTEFPITIGGDFSGRIIEVGSKVTDFKIDDDVFGQASVFGGASGSMAEYLVANTTFISKKPENLNYLEAASLPLVGASAVQAIEDHIQLKKRQKILIQGGAGGIGSIAVQIAKIIGAYVIATVSTENVEFAKSLGADRVIDYKKEDFSKELEGLDAVFDTTGKEVDERSFMIIKRGGVLVSMTSQLSQEDAKKFEITLISQNSQTTTNRLLKLKDYIERGIVKPQVDKIFPLEEVNQAFKFQESVHSRGKVVIQIGKDGK